MEDPATRGAELEQLTLEAAKLAQALSDPGNASEAKSLQERLLAIQKSTAGWAVAESLLNSEVANVRFFGALTLTMKIHQDGERLNDQESHDLLVRLMNFFMLLLSKNETPMVMRKFLTAMTAFFFKKTSRWTRCILHVAVCVANGKYVPEELAGATFETSTLSSLNYKTVMAVLWFSTTLAEESLRYTKVGDPTDRLEANIQDALSLVNFLFERACDAHTATSGELQEQSSQVVTEAMRSLREWLNAMRGAAISTVEFNQTIGRSMDYAVQFLMGPSNSHSSMELLSQTLESQPKLLDKRHINGILEFLVSQNAEQHAMAVLAGEDESESHGFLGLLIQYATIEQVDILTVQPDEKRDKVLFLLYRLLHGEGFAGVDDGAIVQLVEYWTQAADEINELVMEGGLEDINEFIQRNFMRVIQECHGKLQYPDSATLKEWDDDDLASFNYFRRDFSDFLLASYPLLGLDVVRRLQESAITALNVQDWANLEVSMFCLAALADSVAENKHADDILHALFHSQGFAQILMVQGEIPVKPRQTVADVVARYPAYFSRDHSLLPAILNFLFGLLEVPACAQTASKAISTLCQTCRIPLLGQVNEFVDMFYQLCSKTAIASHALERVAEAVAAVVQAVPSDATKASLLVKLLEPLHQQAIVASQASRNSQYDAGLATALVVTRCTASIGKGLRAPEDAIIDLDAADNPTSLTTNFWTDNQAGASVQTLITSILDAVVSEFLADGEIIETICEVLKAGYTEQSGPYVLAPEMTVRFVKAVSASSNRFSTVMGTASAFLAAHASRPVEVSREVVELSMYVYQLVCSMGVSPEQYDPEVAHSCIEFLRRLLPRHKKAFFILAEPQPNGPPPLPAILQFTLEVLKRPDPLPLREACSFWTALLSLPEAASQFGLGHANDSSNGQTTGTPHFIDAYLGQLAEVLIQNVSGGCARSDLDYLSEVIKKFVFKQQGAAREHLANALRHLNVSGRPNSEQPIAETDRERFLSSILHLRGGRETNKVVREFWVLCRGRAFAYTV